MAATPSRLPAIQAQVAAIVPQGASIQGTEAATVGMSSHAILLVSRPSDGVNAGDLYARGVRWVVGRADAPEDVPQWSAAHPSEWAARRMVLTFEWGGKLLNLWELP